MAQPTQERLASQLENPERTSGNVGEAGSGTQSENGPQFQDHEDDHTHHVAMKTYYIIFSLLMVLLFITVGAWYIDQHVFSLGHFSTPIAMAIAVAKAAAIVLFFMHVKFASRLVQIFSCTGIAFVAIMFLLTFNDYGTRPWLPNAGIYTISSAQNSMGNNGDNNGMSGEIIRSSSVGAAPNSNSTPADNMVGSAANAPGNASEVGVDGARDRGSSVQGVVNGGAQPPQPGGGTRGATSMSGALNDPNSAVNQNGAGDSNTNGSQSGTSATSGVQKSGALGASGMAAGRDNTALSGSTQSEGPIVGGAANNVYGSSVQSQGIEPKRVAPAVKSVQGSNPVVRPGSAAERPIANGSASAGTSTAANPRTPGANPAQPAQPVAPATR
jgi:cytochrome c oxidase subunit 4